MQYRWHVCWGRICYWLLKLIWTIYNICSCKAPPRTHFKEAKNNILNFNFSPTSIQSTKREGISLSFFFLCLSVQLSEWSCKFITSYQPDSWVSLVYGSCYWKVESLARTTFAFPLPFPSPNFVCYLVAAEGQTLTELIRTRSWHSATPPPSAESRCSE